MPRRVLMSMFVAASACGPQPHPVAEPPAPSTAVLQPPRAPVVEKRVIITQGRKSGSFVTTYNPDDTITATFEVVENGRGPHVDATLTLAPDGTLASFTATGHHTMGTKVAESFAIAGGHATWKSEEETGQGDAHGPTFYAPISDTSIDAWLVPAALRAGGTLALWPAGEAHVVRIAGAEIDGRKLVGYQVSGFDLTPYYTWFDEPADPGAPAHWFGAVSAFFSVVPEGWDKAIEPLVAKQEALDRARESELATKSAHHPPAAGLAYTHARVLDVVAGKWLADQTVVVVGERITAVGATAKIKLPAGAEVVDLAGKALIPGLVDMHSHTFAPQAPLDIAAGVTTVRDVGNDPNQLDDMKRRFDAGTSVGPHVVRMGFIEGRNAKAASSKITAETPDEARAAVEFFAKRGYEGIKIYNSVPVELVPLLAAEAHKRGMLVTGHIPVHMLAHEAVEAGYDGIEHINMLFLNFLATHDTDTRDTTRFTLVGDHATELDLGSKPVVAFITELVDHHTVIDPTLGAFEDLFAGVPGEITPGLEAMVARLPAQGQRGYLTGGLPLPGDKHALYLKSWDRIFAMVKALYDAKVTIVAGTDSFAGLTLHHELELLARTGIPAAAVMRMATVDAARAMKMDADFGVIAKGKRADLVVLDGDVLADISSVRRVVSTMRAGVVFDVPMLLAAMSVKP